MTTPLVFKLGGELLESAADLTRIARLASALAARQPLIVVHGGGRSVDAALTGRGLVPKKVDGLRITDAATLETVTAVLAGSANTALVAALVAGGVPAVGLTGVDAGLARATRAAAYQTSRGDVVDLGFVGDAITADVALLTTLTAAGYVPVVASLGFDGEVLNINADVMACAIAAALPGSDVVIAGTTPGVLDAAGRTMPLLDPPAVTALVADGTATAGMIAKLTACRAALDAGVSRVRLVDGRGLETIEDFDRASGTAIVAAPEGAMAR